MQKRLCMDCRWYKPSPNTSTANNLDYCTRPDAAFATVDLVRGHDYPSFCHLERTGTSLKEVCGMEGKFWEPHPDTFTTTEEADDGNPSF